MKDNSRSSSSTFTNHVFMDHYLRTGLGLLDLMKGNLNNIACKDIMLQRKDSHMSVMDRCHLVIKWIYIVNFIYCGIIPLPTPILVAYLVSNSPFLEA